MTPSANQSLLSSSQVNITWNTACLNGTKAVDIYLYAPNSKTDSVIQTWTNVDYSSGHYNASLNPAWWNNTSPVALQLAVNDANNPPWMATAQFPAGPIFTVTVDASSSPSTAATNASANGITQVNNVPSASKAPSKGGIAAAVIMTLLAVAVLAGGYVWYARRRRAKQSEQFSEKVDRRMSVVSNAWNPMSNAGFSAWRSSFWGKPEEVAAASGGAAGAGGMAGRGAMMQETNPGAPIARPRPGSRAANANPGARVSRVSFASDSGSGRRSAIFINAGQSVEEVIPPLPALPHMHNIYGSHTGSSNGSDGQMTPSQAYGPEEVNVDDITARLSNPGDDGAAYDDVSPALNMMLHDQFTRMQDAEEEHQQYYQSEYVDGQYVATPTQRANFPVPPTPSYNPRPANARQRSSPPSSFHDPASPTARALSPPPAVMSPTQTHMHTGSGSMNAMPAAQMTPDDMLRAYAESRVASPPIAAQSFPPIPTLPIAGAQGRSLYNPAALPGASQDHAQQQQYTQEQYTQEQYEQAQYAQQQYAQEQYAHEQQYGQEYQQQQQHDFQQYGYAAHDQQYAQYTQDALHAHHELEHEDDAYNTGTH